MAPPPPESTPIESRPETFAELYRAEYSRLVRLAFLLTSSPQAEDLVQDAAMKVYRKWGRAENPAAYLRTAVVNRCHSHLRRRRVERKHERAQRPEVASLDANELGDALQQISEKHRIAIVMRFYLDLPDAEIADAIGCAPGSVRSYVHRGLAELKKVVEQ